MSSTGLSADPTYLAARQAYRDLMVTSKAALEAQVQVTIGLMITVDQEKERSGSVYDGALSTLAILAVDMHAILSAQPAVKDAVTSAQQRGDDELQIKMSIALGLMSGICESYDQMDRSQRPISGGAFREVKDHLFVEAPLFGPAIMGIKVEPSRYLLSRQAAIDSFQQLYAVKETREAVDSIIVATCMRGSESASTKDKESSALKAQTAFAELGKIVTNDVVSELSDSEQAGVNQGLIMGITEIYDSALTDPTLAIWQRCTPLVRDDFRGWIDLLAQVFELDRSPLNTPEF